MIKAGIGRSSFQKENVMEDGQQPKQSEWEEVGARFAAFGASLGEASNATINAAKTQEILEQIQQGLNTAADEIDDAIRTAKADPKMQQFTEEASQTLNHLGEVGEETVQKAKPHVLNALRSFADTIRGLVDDLEKG
jgi:hypothetical protein